VKLVFIKVLINKQAKSKNTQRFVSQQWPTIFELHCNSIPVSIRRHPVLHDWDRDDDVMTYHIPSRPIHQDSQRPRHIA